MKKNKVYQTPNGLSISFDIKRGNKVVKVQVPNYAAFYLFTADSLPLCHEEKTENLQALEDEIAYYVTKYGTTAQMLRVMKTVKIKTDSDFEVLFDNSNGIYNLIEVCLMAKRLGMKISPIRATTDPYGKHSDKIAYTADGAEAYINKFVAHGYRFGCTENGDWVIATRDNECWEV